MGGQPTPRPPSLRRCAPRTIQVWRTLLNWLAFFFQILAQILRCSFLSSATHALLSSSFCRWLSCRSSRKSQKRHRLHGGERVNDPSPLQNLTPIRYVIPTRKRKLGNKCLGCVRFGNSDNMLRIDSFVRIMKIRGF